MLGVIDFVLDAVREVEAGIREGASVADVLGALLPVVLEFVQSDAVLDPERRAYLQGVVHGALRGAGLLERVEL